jgi:hypothetical protein
MPGVPIEMPSVTTIGVEVDRRSARFLDPCPGMIGKLAQVHVARCHRGPAVDDRDQRLGERLVVEAGRAQHGAGGGAGRAVDHFTGRPGRSGHRRVPMLFRIQSTGK